MTDNGQVIGAEWAWHDNIGGHDMPLGERIKQALLSRDEKSIFLRTDATVTAQDIDGRTYFFNIGDTYLHGPDYARRAGLWPEYPNAPETHFLASAEVMLLRPEEAAGNPQAVDARLVLS